MEKIDELLAALESEIENRDAAIAIRVKDSEATVAALLDEVGAAADAVGAEQAASDDGATTAPLKPIHEMYWHEHLEELLGSDSVPAGHIPRLRAIAAQKVPNAGDAAYLANLLRWVRGESSEIPGLIGAGAPGQHWGFGTASW